MDGPIVAGDFGVPHERTGPATTRASACCWAVWADVGETHARLCLQSFLTLADMADRAKGNRDRPSGPWPRPLVVDSG